jgi:hypothetical protein
MSSDAMFAPHVPLMIPVIATGYIVTIYLVLTVLQRMGQFRRP